MPDDDRFELWLSKWAHKRPFLHRMLASANRAGRMARSVGGKRSGFTGARIGRGGGVARVLTSGEHSVRPSARRVIVKARIVKLAGKGAAGAVAHLRYLERDGTTREGERGSLYGADRNVADGKAFLERGSGDRHQFRFIIAPEDGAEYQDLKPLVRRLMEQAEQDLRTRLDWVAVDHFNTGHPHSHVIVRGKDDLGKDLIIAREYMTQGFRARAAELVSLDLGPRTALEIQRAHAREVEQERFINIDRRLLRSIDAAGQVRAIHRDGVEQSLRAGRLQMLGRMGLAKEVRRGRWTLDPDLEAHLTRMSERGDIIRTMQRQMATLRPSRGRAEHAIFDPARQDTRPITGRVLSRGLSDEHADRHYLIIDGVDGRSHYVDIGTDADPVRSGSIVRVSPNLPGKIRASDHMVARVAAAHGGRYTIDLHLLHDPQASEAFAQTHVRRLEAIRRTTGGVAREPDGSWIIDPDHLARVQVYEQALATRTPVLIETLSEQPLVTQQRHNGRTWLDNELVADRPAMLGQGFGYEVRQSLDIRRRWLISQQLAETHDGLTRYKPNMLAALQQRELHRVAAQLSAELGLGFVEMGKGQRVEGKLQRSVQVGSEKFAVVAKSREFTLVPWRAELERQLGKSVAGIMRDGGVDWSIGRSRGPSIGI